MVLGVGSREFLCRLTTTPMVRRTPGTNRRQRELMEGKAGNGENGETERRRGTDYTMIHIGEKDSE